jgi:arsenate reductase
MVLRIYEYSYIKSLSLIQNVLIIMSTQQQITIYHNPACGTSRNTLGLIRNTGIEPIVIEYLLNPPSKSELIQLISDAGLSVRAAIRTNVDPYRELDLDRETWTDHELIEFMLEHPILINRPFVVTIRVLVYADHRSWYWIFYQLHNKVLFQRGW